MMVPLLVWQRITKGVALFQIKKNILQSKVARRIVILFLISAIIPVVLTALLSMGTLANMFNQYSEEQLHRESKFYGMMVLNRLKIVENKLNGLAVLITDKQPDTAEIAKTFHDEAEQILLHGITYNNYQAVGKGREIPETVTSLEGISKNDKARLISVRDGKTARIFIQKGVGQEVSDGYIVAEIKNEFLWGKDEEFPDHLNICISEVKGGYLKCSESRNMPVIDKLIQPEVNDRFFEVTYGDEQYIGANWNLFLKSSFMSPAWRITIVQNKDTIAHPAKLFSTYYPLVIVLSLLIVLFLSINLIRRNLVPLERLLDGTKRIANSEFGEKVVVDSQDEFKELADSFNMMSNKIECQVNALTILTEIDKIILSNPNSEYLYSRVVQFIGRIIDCELCSIFTVGVGGQDSQNEYVALGGKYYCTNSFSNEKIKEELNSIKLGDTYTELDVESESYGFLKDYVLRGVSKVLVFPVRFSEQVPAILLVGIRQDQQLNENETGFLKEVSTRLSVAIATEERDKELYYHSHYDVLTNLPNRYFLTQSLQQLIENARRNENQLAVLFIDLDRFKNINDSLGHSIGDKLLISASERLSQCVRETDLVCRLGGDEFTVILSNVTDRKKVSNIADKIISDLARVFHVDDQELFVSASIGISIYPVDGQTSEELLKNADTAMYRAKQNGRGHHQYYMEYMNREEIQRTNMERQLRSAIAKDQLILLYQPLVNLKTGIVTGAEALLRWDHPERGIISASDFIPLAEETGMIDQIGKWVLTQACHQYVNWMNVGIVLERISVNVSGRQFLSGEFRSTLLDILKETGLSGNNLELEITENLLMDDRCELKEIIDDLHDLGIKFSIDDFGTGYSSLSYLKQFPVDTLKVDRGFLKDVPDSDDACAIVKTIVMMAHTLKLKVIAEGIENTRQLDYLKSIHCNVGQGYFYHAPLGQDEFAGFCINYNTKAKVRSV